MTVRGRLPPLKQRLPLLLVAPLLASCSRAPAFDVLGSFFPAWLVCFFLAVGFTSLARLALARLHMTVPFPVLVYPSLAALFTFALWLIFFS